jgi:hypothetical protein
MNKEYSTTAVPDEKQEKSTDKLAVPAMTEHSYARSDPVQQMKISSDCLVVTVALMGVWS